MSVEQKPQISLPINEKPKINTKNIALLQDRLADLGTSRENLQLTLNALALVYIDLDTKRSLKEAERIINHVS